MKQIQSKNEVLVNILNFFDENLFSTRSFFGPKKNFLRALKIDSEDSRQQTFILRRNFCKTSFIFAKLSSFLSLRSS